MRRIAILGIALGAAIAQAGEWSKLADDGLHDPANPGIKLLQEPGEALSKLPPDTTGNQVRWVRALQEGFITPRSAIRPQTEVRLLDQDIILNKRGSMPLVRFPHKQHTEWLDCSICHDELFKPKAGANKFSMLLILQGEQCGVCHGAVSFPLTECYRCHSVPRETAAPGGKPK